MLMLQQQQQLDHILLLTKVNIADWNLSSTELESGNDTGAFPQTPAPVLDELSGPMGARFLSSTGLEFGTLIGRAQFFPVPALDKNQSPIIPDLHHWSAITTIGCVLRIKPMRNEQTPGCICGRSKQGLDHVRREWLAEERLLSYCCRSSHACVGVLQ